MSRGCAGEEQKIVFETKGIVKLGEHLVAETQHFPDIPENARVLRCFDRQSSADISPNVYTSLRDFMFPYIHYFIVFFN